MLFFLILILIFFLNLINFIIDYIRLIFIYNLKMLIDLNLFLKIYLKNIKLIIEKFVVKKIILEFILSFK